MTSLAPFFMMHNRSLGSSSETEVIGVVDQRSEARGSSSQAMDDQQVLFRTVYEPVPRTGTFFQEKNYFLMYSINELVICVPAPFLKCE